MNRLHHAAHQLSFIYIFSFKHKWDLAEVTIGELWRNWSCFQLKLRVRIHFGVPWKSSEISTNRQLQLSLSFLSLSLGRGGPLCVATFHSAGVVVDYSPIFRKKSYIYVKNGASARRWRWPRVCVRPAAAKNRLLSSAKHVVELERATHWWAI